MLNTDAQDVIDKLTKWAESKSDIRAAILTSSWARPDATPDEFSDFDVIFVAEDIKPYRGNESWLEGFGRVLVVYRDPVQTSYGYGRFIDVTQYESGLKIDFTLWPVGLMKHVAGMKQLPDYIDDGYKVLLDKDGLTQGMKKPSCRAFVPRPPTEAEYLQFIEEFLSNAPYVAKHIRRGDYFPLKSMLNFMRYEKMCKIIEWQVQIEHGWSLKSGLYGKELSRYLSPGLISEIENTHTGTGAESDWESLFRIMALFRKVAKEVGNRLGYTYPDEMDSRVAEYLKKVRDGELP
jgi:aminoglycoside 6-adenylyltransferase